MASLCIILWQVSAVHAASTAPTDVVLDFADPVEMLFSPDGARLYILCQQSGEVRVLNAATYAPIKTIVVGHVPRGFSLSADGKRLFVANSWDDTISIIDTSALSVVSTWHVAMEPTSVVESPAGKYLFVANRISNDVAVLDPHTGKVEKRLAAGRGASYMTLSPGASRLYVTSVYPNPSPWRTPPDSEVTVIDTATAQVVDRIPLRSIAGVFHVAFSADGRLGAIAELHPKNLVPLTAVEHGAAFVDTLTLFGPDIGSKPVEIPLDELERYAARPFGVAITRDKSRLYVTSGGSEIVTVIDLPRLLQYIRTHRGPYANDLSASANYVITRIPVGHDPRGVALTRDGARLLVANRLDDTISVIDTRSNRVESTIPLRGSSQLWALHFGDKLFSGISNTPEGRTRCADCHIDAKHRSAPEMKLSRLKQILALRRGEQTFYTARYSFHGEIGCANCHIDSTFDGLEWDLEPDGLGRNIVDNRLLEDVKDTGPFKWNGGNPNLPTECGPRTEKYFWRSENYDDRTLADITAYINSLPPRPNRWLAPNGELTSAQERGKVIFERSVDNFGKPIPLENRCSYCHSGPLGTSKRSFDVGTKNPDDDSGLLDTPQLVNVALTGPFLHDGRAGTLEEIWTIYNPHDQHGRTNDLTKDELNDLIEYLRTR
ncbi:MAG TPA: beta-propeller fold lactonase family protein [Terracidiphilus sp.]|nr:beta-propeller fold lactonase family protein [Terracidiphilus sp.]